MSDLGVLAISHVRRFALVAISGVLSKASVLRGAFHVTSITMMLSFGEICLVSFFSKKQTPQRWAVMFLEQVSWFDSVDSFQSVG